MLSPATMLSILLLHIILLHRIQVGASRTADQRVPSSSEAPISVSAAHRRHLQQDEPPPRPTGRPTRPPSTYRPTRPPTTRAPTTPRPTAPQFDYFDEPKVSFATQLPDTGTASQAGIRRSNAVQLSPDETRLYVTLTDGTLHSLDPETGDVIATHTPDPYQSGWTVECESGTDFYMDDDYADAAILGQYFVYSIADIGPQGEKQSRVIALSHPSAEHLWTSPPMPGEVAGTPSITASGRFIFLTRNTEDGTVGHFTILSTAGKGKAVFNEDSDQYKEEDRAPFGPVGLARNPVNGASWDKSGIPNSNDVAWWAHSTDAGRADDGLTKGFQLPPNHDGVDFSGLRAIKLKPVQWTTTDPPVFSNDGDDVYFSGTRAGIRAWIDGADGNEKASWSVGLTRKNNDGLQPLYSSVALAPDEGNMYVASATTTFAKISRAGVIQWEVDIGSVALGRAHVSPDNRRVYFIEAKEGTVAAHDTTTPGARLWSIGCQEYLKDENCLSHTVEGEFSLSADGTIIYFGNRVGQVIALQVGNPPTDPPTPVPTPRPTRPRPPGPVTVLTPSPTEELTDEPTFNPVPMPTMEPDGEATISPWPTWDTEEPTMPSSSASILFGGVYTARFCTILWTTISLTLLLL